ncbi:MAG: hypothetical protein IPL46_11255 [Saprospiraceae bacterium]|nr:hypothetical protein [Saprospiraceae bacterium]
MKEDQNHDRLPDFLREMRNDNPFVTPHNYFKELPDQIMSRIQSDKSGRQVSKWAQLLMAIDRIFIPKLAWALATVIIVTGLFYLNLPRPVATESFNQEFSATDIAQYVQTNIDDFDESDFYDHDLEAFDLLGESINNEDIDPIFHDLLDDIDLETLQRIL